MITVAWCVLAVGLVWLWCWLYATRQRLAELRQRQGSVEAWYRGLNGRLTELERREAQRDGRAAQAADFAGH